MNRHSNGQQDQGNYWERLRSNRMSRRSMLGAATRAGVGAAGIVLVGCGDDDDDAQQQTAAVQQTQQQQQQAPATQQQQQQQAAVAQAQQSPGPRRGGTMRVGTGRALAEHQAAFPFGAWGEAFPLYLPMQEGLTRYGAGLEPEPRLAESWEFNDDQSALQVKLRPDLEFHDGKPLTAEEVKRSFEANIAEGAPASQVAGVIREYIESIDVVDKTTLTFNLAWRGTYIFDVFNFANVADVDNIPELDGYQRINGSGPFKFDRSSYRVDEFHRMERFENYYEPSNLDAIECYTFPDESAMALALEADEVDFTNVLPHPLYDQFDSNPDMVLQIGGPVDSIFVIGMVSKTESGGSDHFDNPILRQAMHRVIDRERIVNELFAGLADTRNVLWAPHSPAYDPNRDYEYFNLEEARELVTRAGYGPEGTPMLKIATFGGPQQEILELVQQDAREAGINYEVDRLEFNIWLERFLGGTHTDGYCSHFGFFQLHPPTLPIINYQMRTPVNACAYDSEEYQAVIDAWQMAATERDRAAADERFNVLWDNEQWVTPVATANFLFAWHKRINGWSENATGMQRWQDFWIDENV